MHITAAGSVPVLERLILGYDRMLHEIVMKIIYICENTANYEKDVCANNVNIFNRIYKGKSNFSPSYNQRVIYY